MNAIFSFEVEHRSSDLHEDTIQEVFTDKVELLQQVGFKVVKFDIRFPNNFQKDAPAILRVRRWLADLLMKGEV